MAVGIIRVCDFGDQVLQSRPKVSLVVQTNEKNGDPRLIIFDGKIKVNPLVKSFITNAENR